MWSRIVWELMSPEKMKELLPLSKEQRDSVIAARKRIEDILKWESDRFMLIIWPCSADYEDSYMEYWKKLKAISEEVRDKIEIVLRFYPWKPRTVWWWKWLVYSSPWNNANIWNGIYWVRAMALRVLELWLPLADEMLNAQLVDYVDDYLSYVAIWARSTENQYHREVCSWLDIPFWVKNPTSWDVGIMINSIRACQTPSHHTKVWTKERYLLQKISEMFNWMWPLWEAARRLNAMFSKTAVHVVDTDWNPYAHWILRWGSSTGPNFWKDFIEKFINWSKWIQNPWLVIDCSHDNCKDSTWSKDPERQSAIAKEVVWTIIPEIKENNDGATLIKWLMIESYLFDWAKTFEAYKEGETVLRWLSHTDPCIWWEKTEKLIKDIHSML